MKRSAIIVIIIMLVPFASCKKTNKWFGKNNASQEQIYELQEENRTLKEQIRKDSVKYAQEMEDMRRDYEMQMQEMQAGTSEVSSTEYNTYYVIVGSFKTDKYAREYAEKIKSMGYEGKIIEGPNNFKLVTSGTYQNLNSAMAPLKDARSRLASKAWVYFKK